MDPLHNNLFLGRTSESFQMVRLGVDVFHSSSVCQWRFNAPSVASISQNNTTSSRPFVAFILRFLLQEVDPLKRSINLRGRGYSFNQSNVLQLHFSTTFHVCLIITDSFLAVVICGCLIGTFTWPLPRIARSYLPYDISQRIALFSKVSATIIHSGERCRHQHWIEWQLLPKISHNSVKQF